MKLVKKYPILGSSADETKLAMTVKGILVALVPILLAVAKAYDLPLVEADLTDLIQSVVALISAVMVLYGVGRKIYLKLKK